MNKLYPLLLLSTIIVAGCSKDFLRSYEKRIEGTWILHDIDTRGPGSSRPMPVKEGEQFIFSEDGSLQYTRLTGDVISGVWDISRRNTNGNCYTNDYGDRVCETREVKTLNLQGVDFTNQVYFGINFDEMVFTGTNRFKVYIYEGAKTYIFRFRR